MRSRGRICVALAIAGALSIAPQAFAEEVAGPSLQDLSQLSIDDLANIPVTSVSKRAEPLSQAPAAIFVITRDDIRRSGATSIPEILRLAPNLQVAQTSASTYAITARGFNHSTSTANKLLVLIDGRIVYSPLFSGVFWDAQNTLVEDIERIEVISGPAGALWGANAVNGVINIITRRAADTQGTLFSIQAGTLDDGISARHGGTLGDDATYRVYGLGFRKSHLIRLNGMPGNDGWDNAQGGFRVDWKNQGDAVTLQGDIYSGGVEDVVGQIANGTIGGENILANWTRQFADGSTLKSQFYYDNARRDLTSGIRASVDTYDFDTQYAFSLGQRNSMVIGGGYRATLDTFIPGPHTSFLDPGNRTLRLGNIFAQDVIDLAPSLSWTVGMKVEHNSYTGFEYMPDTRLAWRVSDTAVLWASVSRAVRTPSRFDRDLFSPGTLEGGPDFQSEDLLAYEIGYRGQPLPDLSLSVSTYFNVYDNLRTVEASGPLIFPLIIENGMRGHTYGVEAWATYALTDWWHLNASADGLRKELSLAPGSRDIFGVAFAGNDPAYQFQLRSDMDLAHGVSLELGLRGVDSLASPAVPGYAEANARLSWTIRDGLELSLVGMNLLHARHQEFASTSLPPLEIPRSGYLSARWEF